MEEVDLIRLGSTLSSGAKSKGSFALEVVWILEEVCRAWDSASC
jgi:hypothetical protein